MTCFIKDDKWVEYTGTPPVGGLKYPESPSLSAVHIRKNAKVLFRFDFSYEMDIGNVEIII